MTSVVFVARTPLRADDRFNDASFNVWNVYVVTNAESTKYSCLYL